MRIGVDTGGTFTDFVWVSGGKRHALKLHSTPSEPGRAVLEGIGQILKAKKRVPGKLEIIHGTTAATNALLTRSGTRTVLVTTAGMEDVIEIGRQERPELYALHPGVEEPLVPPGMRVGVRERLDAEGSVVLVLAPSEVERVVRKVVKRKPGAVAVCLLHSFVNPKHEQRVARALRKALGAEVPVVASSDVDPGAREYERTSTTVIHAYLSGVVVEYLDSLNLKLERIGESLGRGREWALLKCLTSSGGTVGVAQVSKRPADLVLSGPAGGVAGASAAAARARVGNFIGLDMGGTSTDVCLGVEGTVMEDAGRDIAGFPLRLPRLAVHTIGAGGGSIARRGLGGALVVGPESAGADPGPAAYGRGEAVTVTDANLVLGKLPPDVKLGGHTEIDVERARDYLSRLAGELSLSTEECARGIERIADRKMARAVRDVSEARGYDPRGFTLIPFGGAGGLHACGIAEMLGITRILVPPQAGCLSALGALIARPRRDAGRAVLKQFGRLKKSELTEVFDSLEGKITGELDGKVSFRHEVHCRYEGQSYELAVPANGARGSGIAANDVIEERFHEEHERMYGYARPGFTVEVVGANVAGTAGRPSLRGVWNVAEEGSESETSKLKRGVLRGPMSVVETTATTFIAEGWKGKYDEDGNLRMTR